MNYLTTNFREFIKTHLIKETKKEHVPAEKQNENKSTNMAWLDEMKEEFNKIMGDYDDLYK